MRLLSVLAALLALPFCLAAHADVFTSYVAFNSSGGIDDVGFTSNADQLVAVTGNCPSADGICC